MKKFALFAVAACVLGSAPAYAGWVVEWSNTVVRVKGERMPSEPSTNVIADGKMKTTQTGITTITDYEKSTMLLVNPEKKVYWQGTIDEYLSSLRTRRAEGLSRGKKSLEKALTEEKKVDPKDLPAIEVKKSGETREILGHKAERYIVNAGGQLFQEFWIASDVDMTKDLSPEKFVALQEKMASRMIGQVAKSNQALYLSEDYKNLFKSGAILAATNYHGAGSFERVATAIRSTDIASSEFEVPEGFRKVRYNEVFPKENDDAGGR